MKSSILPDGLNHSHDLIGVVYSLALTEAKRREPSIRQLAEVGYRTMIAVKERFFSA